jgi:hypothetical protein
MGDIVLQRCCNTPSVERQRRAHIYGDCADIGGSAEALFWVYADGTVRVADPASITAPYRAALIIDFVSFAHPPSLPRKPAERQRGVPNRNRNPFI